MVQLARYELGEKDFERFRQLISQVSGVYIDQGKRDMLQSGLSDCAEEAGASSLADYYRILSESPERELKFRRLLARLSIQETQFFRGAPQFDALRRYVIPEIVRRKQMGNHRHLRFWSAGCSSGQEPYSIAMSVLDVLDGANDWNVEVLGTDLNDEAIDVAEKGWYQDKKLAGIDSRHRDRYFRQQDGGAQITETVRRLVRFHNHNMVTDPLPIDTFGTCDVIFCRNVIIYFTNETAKYVIDHFYDILNPGGYLFLGHSETLWKMSAKYSLVELGDAFIYKKSLPRSMDGKRFIPDRRMRNAPLPPGVEKDRRVNPDRRGE